MDSDSEDKPNSLCGFAKDHLTVNHIRQEFEKQFTVAHLQQRCTHLRCLELQRQCKRLRHKLRERNREPGQQS